MTDQNPEQTTKFVATRDNSDGTVEACAGITVELWEKLEQARNHQWELAVSQKALAETDRNAAKQLASALGTKDELDQAVKALEAGVDEQLQSLPSRGLEQIIGRESTDKIRRIELLRERQKEVAAERQIAEAERDRGER